MTEIKQRWVLTEPSCGGTVDSLRVESLGSIPGKTERLSGDFTVTGIGIVLEGIGTYRVNDEAVQQICGPAAFAIWPGDTFHYGPVDGESWDELFFCFSGARVDDWWRWKWLSRGVRKLAPLRTGSIQNCHERIRILLESAGHPEVDEARLQAEQLVHALYSAFLNRHNEQDPLETLVGAWRAALPGQVDLPEIAKQLGMSYSSFREQFKKRYGVSPYRYFTQLRMDAAAKQLLATDASVKLIAYEVGFKNVESFHRMFRERMGLTPLELRRRSMT